MRLTARGAAYRGETANQRGDPETPCHESDNRPDAVCTGLREAGLQ
jgi:hypothetical protein